MRRGWGWGAEPFTARAFAEPSPFIALRAGVQRTDQHYDVWSAPLSEWTVSR